MFFFGSRCGRTWGKAEQMCRARALPTEKVNKILIKKTQLLVTRPRAWYAPVAKAGAVGKARIARLELGLCLRPAGGKPFPPPDLVKPPRIAAVSLDQRFDRHP